MVKRRTVRRIRKFRRYTRKVPYPVKRYVARAFNKRLERKYIDNNTSTAVTSTGYFTLLNGCQEGTGSINRVGDSIFMKSVQVSGYVSNSDNASRIFFISLLYDKQPNGSTPAFTDVYTGSPFVAERRDLDWSRRFRTLWSWRFTLAPLGVDSTSLRVIDKYIRLRHPTRYQTNNGDITDITSGALFLLLQSSDPTDGVPTVLNMRVRFQDA